MPAASQVRMTALALWALVTPSRTTRKSDWRRERTRLTFSILSGVGMPELYQTGRGIGNVVGDSRRGHVPLQEKRYVSPLFYDCPFLSLETVPNAAGDMPRFKRSGTCPPSCLDGCRPSLNMGPVSLIVIGRAGVAELADARDSKSRPGQLGCGFDSLHRHQISPDLPPLGVRFPFSAFSQN